MRGQHEITLSLTPHVQQMLERYAEARGRTPSAAFQGLVNTALNEIEAEARENAATFHAEHMRVDRADQIVVVRYRNTLVGVGIVLREAELSSYAHGNQPTQGKLLMNWSPMFALTYQYATGRDIACSF